MRGFDTLLLEMEIKWKQPEYSLFRLCIEVVDHGGLGEIQFKFTELISHLRRG